MALRSRFNAEKAVEVLLYVTKSVPDMYHALKVVYFADKEHLTLYGRQLCGDSYVAMKLGPVPSGMYDLIKTARGDGCCFAHLRLPESLAVALDGKTILPKRPPNTDLLSESEMECLDSAVSEYGSLSFGKLKELSHRDAAYRAADRNDFMSLESIVESLPEGDILLAHLNDH